MGLLDQLRQESDSAKNAEQQEKEKLYAYLQELEEHLNYLKPDIRVNYEIPGFGHLYGLLKGGYHLDKGRSEVLKRVPFKFKCSSNDKIKLNVDGNRKLNLITEALDQHGLSYVSRSKHDANNTVYGAEITLETRVPVTIVFTGVIETTVSDQLTHLDLTNRL